MKWNGMRRVSIKNVFADKKIGDEKLKLRTGLAFCDACHQPNRQKGVRCRVTGLSVVCRRNITNKVTSPTTIAKSHDSHLEMTFRTIGPPGKQQKSSVIKFFSYSSLQFIDNWLESHSSRTVWTVDRKKNWKLLKLHAKHSPPARRNSRHDFIFKLVSDWNMLHIIKIVFASTRLEFLYFGNFMTVRR